MRQIQDMRPSSLAVGLIYGGALLATFGLAAFLSPDGAGLGALGDKAPWVAGALALAGVATWWAGYHQGQASRQQAYEHYLRSQETADLQEALAQGWADEKSRAALVHEMDRRMGKTGRD